jgi:hypothetical protein
LINISFCNNIVNDPKIDKIIAENIAIFGISCLKIKLIIIAKIVTINIYIVASIRGLGFFDNLKAIKKTISGK